MKDFRDSRFHEFETFLKIKEKIPLFGLNIVRPGKNDKSVI